VDKKVIENVYVDESLDDMHVIDVLKGIETRFFDKKVVLLDFASIGPGESYIFLIMGLDGKKGIIMVENKNDTNDYSEIEYEVGECVINESDNFKIMHLMDWFKGCIGMMNLMNIKSKGENKNGNEN